MDLFHIPGDTGGDWRIDQFVKLYTEYPDDAIPIILDLCEGLSADEKVWLIYLFSVCYNIPTALYLSKKIAWTSTKEELEESWSEKQLLIFQSDRRWIKQRDEFVFTVYDFIQRCKGSPYKFIMSFMTSDPKETYTNIFSEMRTWNNFGPFGISLFLRIFMNVFPVKIQANNFDWKNGRQSLTIRECLYIMSYQDEKAQETYKLRKADKKGILSKLVSDEECKLFDSIIDKISEKVNKINPSLNYEFNEGLSMLCFYRKMYKNKRYFGYYLDRGLSELLFMERNHPDDKELWNKIRESRKKNYPNKLLGEISGWTGPRNYLNSYFTETGDVLTNVSITTLDNW